VDGKADRQEGKGTEASTSAAARAGAMKKVSRDFVHKWMPCLESMVVAREEKGEVGLIGLAQGAQRGGVERGIGIAFDDMHVGQ
jgi:hypothetical protein